MTAPSGDFVHPFSAEPDSRYVTTKWYIRWEWKVADAWVGVFWHRGSWSQAGSTDGRTLDIWVCILPMLPIHLRRVEQWDTCYECGRPVGGHPFERHGRAGAVHLECAA